MSSCVVEYAGHLGFRPPSTRDAFCRTSTDFVLRACRCSRSVPSGLHKTFLLLASSWDFVCVCLSYGCKFLRKLAVLRVTLLLLTVLTVKILVNLLPGLLKTLGLRASELQEMVSAIGSARKRSCFLQARVILESASHTIFWVLMDGLCIPFCWSKNRLFYYFSFDVGFKYYHFFFVSISPCPVRNSKVNINVKIHELFYAKQHHLLQQWHWSSLAFSWMVAWHHNQQPPWLPIDFMLYEQIWFSPLHHEDGIRLVSKSLASKFYYNYCVFFYLDAS